MPPSKTMEQNAPAIHARTVHCSESPRWWLPLGIFISLALHLLLALGISYRGWLSPPIAAEGSPLASARLVLQSATTTATAKQTRKQQPDLQTPPQPSARSTPIPHPRATPLPNDATPLVQDIPHPAPSSMATESTNDTPIDDVPERDAIRPNASPSPATPVMTTAEIGRATVTAPTTHASPAPDTNLGPAPGTIRIDLGGNATGTSNPSTPASSGGNPAPVPSPGAPEVFGITRGMPFYNGPLSGDGTTPVHIVYLVDISGSMEEDGKIVMVRKAMENALQELRPGDFFNILYFSDQVSPFARTMCPVSSNTLRAALGSLNVVEPQGATDLSNALDLAFRQQDVTHILILTDGEPTEGITDFDALAEFAQHHNSNNAHILTLGLNKDKVFKAEPLLRQLAADSHGTYHAIDVTQLNKTP